MLNKEKYRDEIFKIALKHGIVAKIGKKLCTCDDVYDCEQCDFDNMGEDKCVVHLKMANSEYIELEIDWTKFLQIHRCWQEMTKMIYGFEDIFVNIVIQLTIINSKFFLKVEHLGLLKETVIVIHIVNLREKKTLKNTERYKA